MTVNRIFSLLCVILLIQSFISGLFVPLILQVIHVIDNDPSSMPQINGAIKDVMSGTGFVILLSPAFLLFAPIIGIAVDQWGRKKFLAIAILCEIIGYSAILMGVYLNELKTILFGILVLSISNTDLPITLTITTDLATAEQRLRYFVIIQAVVLTLTIVAKVGEFFLQAHPGYPIINPIHAIGLLITAALINFLLVKSFLPETLPVRTIKPSLTTDEILNRFSRLFGEPGILKLLMYLIIIYFCWGLHFQFSQLYAHEQLGWKTHTTNILFLYQIVIMLTTSLIFYFKLFKSFSSQQLLFTGIIICAVGFIGCGCWQTSLGLWIFSALIAIGTVLFIPTLWTVVSLLSPKADQGLLMCMIAPLWAVSWMTSGIVAVNLSAYDLHWPFYLLAIGGTILLLLSLMQKQFFKEKLLYGANSLNPDSRL